MGLFHNMPTKVRELEVCYRSASELIEGLSTDAKTALFYGDLELEDVLDEEVSVTTRFELRRKIRAWGRRRGLECE